MCVLTLAVEGQPNIYDDIVVSVGSKILPAFEVDVLTGGLVKYSLPSDKAPHWISDDPNVATIDTSSGLLRALTPGRTKVSSESVFGWVNVRTVKRVEQVD
jgi:hypothetical protein